LGHVNQKGVPTDAKKLCQRPAMKTAKDIKSTQTDLVPPWMDVQTKIVECKKELGGRQIRPKAETHARGKNECAKFGIEKLGE